MGAPVVWTQSDHSPPGGGLILDRHPVIRATRELWHGDETFELFAGMTQPRPGEHRVVKHKYDAFHNTDLDSALRNIGKDTVIITGVATEICCESTARAAFFRDYKVVFVRDATAAFDPAIQEATCDRMDDMFARAMTTGDVLAALRDGE
jgi:ureidoacrylate peracid hydrolase